MRKLSIQWIYAAIAAVVCAGGVAGQISINSSPASGEVGVAYSQQVVSGGTGSYSYILIGSPPAGLTLNPDGSLSGNNPIAATGPSGTSFTVTATDSAQNTATGTVTVVIYQQLANTTAPLPSGTQGVAYSAPLSATGGTGSYTWSLLSVNPAAPWLSVAGSALTATAPLAGTYTVTVQVTDSIATVASSPLTLVIAVPVPTVTTNSLPSGEATAPYPGATLAATGGTPPYKSWALTTGTLPSGLTLNPSSGAISGTLAATATTATGLVFTVTDSANSTANSAPLTLTVNSAPVVTGPSLPAADPSVAYPTQTLTASGGASGGYTWSVSSGALPTGLSLGTSTGQITGTPTASGTFTFTAQAKDTAGGFGTQSFSITINPALTITSSATLPSGEIKAPYPAGTTLTATGGTGSGYTWSVSGGALPGGLTLTPSTGAITGTPTASGPFNFTAKVVDSGGGSATQTFSVTITPGPTISTAPTLPNGTVGVVYTTVTLAATGGTSPYTWSIIQSAPPAGINLDGNSGTLSGTPTASGTSTFTVQVQDAKSVTATKVFTITIAAGLTITTAPSLPNGTIGQAYTLTLQAAGGTSPYAWQVTTGALPGGLTLGPSSGAITGTPTSNGTFNFTVQVTDSTNVMATKPFTLIVASGLNITNAPTLPSGVVGGSYSQSLNATGGTSPYTWSVSAGSLPGGLTLSPSSGAITGTPTTGGTFSFTITVTDSASVTATKSFSLSIAALLAISTQPTLPSGGVGTSYTQPLTAVGGTAPYTWLVSAGSLPAGLSLSPSSGTISGTPTSVGNYSFTLQVTDNNSVSVSKAFTLAIVSALTITTQPTLPGGAVSVGYSQSIVVVGGNAPYTWSISSGALPAGLTLSPSSGAITGTPTSAGGFTFTVQVVDASSVSVNKAFSMAVVAGLTITTAPVLPSDSVGVGYAVTLAAAGGSTPYTWTVSAGGLPGGLTLDAKSGSIFGTPTASGSFTFTVKVTDNASNTATKQFSIAIASGLTITTAPVLPNGAIGASYSQTLDAVGGAAQYSWSVSQGALPGGVTLSPTTGMISGTPAASGTFNFTVQVTDTASATATKLFALTVSASLTITTPSTLPSGSVGVPYSFTFNVAGGTGPYQWTAAGGALPSGLTLDASAGVLSGTPLSAGAFTFSITVSDTAQHQASQQFNVTIASGLVISSAAQLPAGSVGNAYSQTLSVAGGTPPYHWTVASGALPAGLALSSGGVLGGIPTANGTFQFTAQVTDSAGGRASLQFSLSIGSGLAITSGASLPSGTLGLAYTPLALAAAGGRQPYTWAVTSGAIAPGLTLSASGTITGTPTSAGAFQFTVQVTDSNRATATLAFTISILPPALPQVNISGVPETATSADQIDFSVALGSGYPLAITGTVTLTFAPDAVAPADDPAIQLSTGGRTANFTIAANATKAVFPVPQMALQTGTVSGTITLAFTLEAGGTQLPASGLTRTITIGRAAPVISAVKLVTSSNTLQVQVTGYSSPRELTEADVTFTAASGSTLQTTSAIIDLTAVGKQWFQGSSSAQYGSQFVLVMPFTATQGSISAVGSVSVVLKNSTGASPASSASF